VLFPSFSPFRRSKNNETQPNQEGDLILTGTPSGVGPVVPGDRVECLLADAQGGELIKLDFTAVQREGGYRFQSED
jgi:acylpyruvate hydrolase